MPAFSNTRWLVVAAIAVSAAAAVLVPTGSAISNVTCTKYASPSGSDANAGTESAPYRTPQYLASHLSSGETGCLLGGTYTANVEIAAPGITLTSAPEQRAKLRGYVLVRNTANDVTIRDLDVDGSVASKAFAVGVLGDSVVLSNLDITNPKYHGSTVDGICLLAGPGFESAAANTAYNLTVQGSRIHNCGDDAHEHAIYLESTRNAHIIDSYLYANPGYGVSMYPDAQGSVIEYNVIDGNSSADRANLTFSGEVAGGEYSQPHGSDNNTVRYNLITNAIRRYNVDSYYPGGSITPRNNRVTDNCVWNAPYGNFGGTSAYTQSNTKDINPLYVDRAAGNFTLQSGSPCVGWGPRSSTAPAPPSAPAPDFTLSASPTSQTVVRGGSASYGLTLTPLGGFVASAALSVSGLSPGASASFSTPTLSSSAVLTVSTASTMKAGTHTLTVQALSDGITRSVVVTLQIRRR